MSAAALLALALASGAPACDQADLLPAAEQKVSARALLTAACGTDCVLQCPKGQEPGQDEEAPQQLVAHYEGSFRCAGKLESVVSLFPCGDAMGMHGIAGTVVLVRATRAPGTAAGAPRWRKAGTVENTVLNGECRTARVGDRDVLLCLSGWGPMQGTVGQSLCAIRWAEQLEMKCPLRAEDNCLAGTEGASSAEVKAWSVGAAAPDGSVPVHVTVERGDCEGQHKKTSEERLVIDAAGMRLVSPP